MSPPGTPPKWPRGEIGGLHVFAFVQRLHCIVTGHRRKALDESGRCAASAAGLAGGIALAIAKFRHEPAECLGVLLGNFRNRLAGAIHILPDRDGCAIQKRNVHDRIGLEVFQAVLLQTEFAVNGASYNIAVHARAKIFFEASQAYFLRLAAAADRRTAFQNEHFVACLCQICRADQTVVPGARDHDIEPVPRRPGRLLTYRWKGRQGERRKRGSLYEYSPTHWAH